MCVFLHDHHFIMALTFITSIRCMSYVWRLESLGWSPGLNMFTPYTTQIGYGTNHDKHSGVVEHLELEDQNLLELACQTHISQVQTCSITTIDLGEQTGFWYNCT